MYLIGKFWAVTPVYLSSPIFCKIYTFTVLTMHLCIYVSTSVKIFLDTFYNFPILNNVLFMLHFVTQTFFILTSSVGYYHQETWCKLMKCFEELKDLNINTKKYTWYIIIIIFVILIFFLVGKSYEIILLSVVYLRYGAIGSMFTALLHMYETVTFSYILLIQNRRINHLNRELEKLSSKRFVTFDINKEIKNMTNIYKLCSNVGEYINIIFGWPILFLILMTVVNTLIIFQRVLEAGFGWEDIHFCSHLIKSLFFIVCIFNFK